MKYYIFEDGRISHASVAEFTVFMECFERHVGDTYLGIARVSTIFLGLNGRAGSGAPILFETMTFAHNVPALNNNRFRYETFEQARRGHRVAVERLAEFLPDETRRDLPPNCGKQRPGTEARAREIRDHLGWKDD